MPKRQTRKNNRPKKLIEGQLILTARGVGFLTHPEFKEDIRIPAHNIKSALHGDTVKVEVFKPKKRGEQPEGRITKILERNRLKFVGSVLVEKNKKYVLPDDRKFPGTILIPKNESKKVRDEQKVLVKVFWENDGQPKGNILEIIGDKGDHEVEMKSILLEKGIDINFPKEVEKEARDIAQKEKPIPQAEIKNRRDYRSVNTFTIDPVDAKDFDDAISIKKLPDGNFEIGIHIADVSHYVKEGTALDKEAGERGFSVYLVDRTIPMLPEVLSNDLCSLNPNEDKLAFSAIFKMNLKGKVLKKWFGKTVINSNKRFTYEEAQGILNEKKGKFSNELLTLNKIAKELSKEKQRTGAIDFATDEVRFELDENGEPIKIYKKERLDTHKLVEEYMLLANKEVALFLFKFEKDNGNKKGPSIYRIHDAPNPEKLADLGIFLRALGYEIDLGKENITSKDLQLLMKKIEGKAEEALIKTATLRTMAKAVYSTKNIGHFGLAFQYYTHFTSPIRRYPDLLVHRILWKYLSGGKVKSKDFERYTKMAREASDKEIKAAEAERDSIKYKQVEYMEDHIGKVFNGTITGVTEWGIYIEEENTKAEGMVKISELGDDYYNLDKKTYSIIGEKTKKKFSLGDQVKFKVVDANPEKRTLDFVLV